MLTFAHYARAGARYYNSPLTTMLNGQKKKGHKNMLKFKKNQNFTILLTTLVEAYHRSIHEFWGMNLECTYKGDVSIRGDT